MIMMTKDSSQSLIQLETFTVRGSYSELGRAYGNQFRSKTLSFIEMRLSAAEQYFRDWGRGSVDELLSVGAQCWSLARDFHPEAAREQEGIAAAIGVSPERLYATTNMTDIRDVVLLPDVPPPKVDEGCTSVLLPPYLLDKSSDVSSEYLARQEQGGLYGQTWDLNPPDIEYIVALHRVPDHGLETWTVTCTGCLTLVGMNERGISVGTTNLKTWRSRVGVGYLSVLHKAVSQPTFTQASIICESAPVAGAHSYWVGGVDRGIEWERSPDEAFQRSTEEGVIGRTNHCLFTPHQVREAVPPPQSSQARLERVTSLISQPQHQSIKGLKAVFADRSDGVDSINRYPEDEQGTTTNSVVITDPRRGELHACRGSADRGQWVTLTFERAHDFSTEENLK